MDNQDLRKVGLKVTTPRTKILAVLESSRERHMSAEDVYKTLLEQGDEIALATVYRVLTQFEETGLVERHNFEENHSVFELNVGTHHDHLICIKCGKVDEFVDDVIEQRQKAIAERANFKITDHALNIYGICSTCV